jgi:hypothetical protein
VSARNYKSRLFSLLRVRDDDTTSELERSNHQRYGRAAEAHDNQRIAFETREAVMDLWVIEGL